MKLAIFDFEGTLVDFQWQLQAALEALVPKLDEFIVKADLDREIVVASDYCRLFNYLQSSITDTDLRSRAIATVNEVFDQFDADAARRWQLYPEVRELLSGLREAGWGLALDSNVGRRALDLMLEKFSLAGYFDFTITRNDVVLLKPAPEGIEKIMRCYRDRGVEVVDALLIGDSVTDIETARNAGIGIAVRTNGEDRTARLKFHSPDYLVENLSELMIILD